MNCQHEYRVVSKREGRKRISIVIGPRWLAEEIQASEKERLEDAMGTLPPLEYCHVEQRPVGRWRRVRE